MNGRIARQLRKYCEEKKYNQTDQLTKGSKKSTPEVETIDQIIDRDAKKQANVMSDYLDREVIKSILKK